MISVAQLIGVFVMCFVFILGAYLLGHDNGYDEGVKDGACRAWREYRQLLNLREYAEERLAMKGNEDRID